MELWKKIDNCDNYEISSLGRVRSIDFIVNRGNGRPMPIIGKILSTHKNDKGYVSVSLYDNNKKHRRYQVHRLVAKAFIPNPNNLPQVNHKDENKENNSINNLEWCTQNYNINYGNRNKHISESNKNNPKVSKVILQYDKDKNLVQEWASMNEIKRVLNYSIGNIYNCCNFKYKQAYGYIWRYKEY